MGCTQSSSPVAPAAILQCPEDFPPQQFAQICRLYDRLDADGNRGVAVEELEDIAVLHVKNRIILNAKQKDHRIQQKMFEVQQAKAAERARIEDIQQRCAAARATLQRKCERDVADMDAEAVRLSNLNSVGQTAEFMKVLDSNDKDGYIDFWKFFDYMRTRTQDIKNIPEE
jgi:hypothetical protein